MSMDFLQDISSSGEALFPCSSWEDHIIKSAVDHCVSITMAHFRRIKCVDEMIHEMRNDIHIMQHVWDWVKFDWEELRLHGKHIQEQSHRYQKMFDQMTGNTNRFNIPPSTYPVHFPYPETHIDRH
uniref:Uncharacterized protein n=1 Tax=Moniliophthora roreri TaxID=221103 RepID=A0A0W0FN16_MONRR